MNTTNNETELDNNDQIDETALIVVSHASTRNLKFRVEGDQTIVESEPGGGGVQSALDRVVRGRRGSVWVNYLGELHKHARRLWEPKLTAQENGCKMQPVLVENDTLQTYYGVVSSGLLWFLFHGMHEYVTEKISDRAWAEYRLVNSKFAAEVIDMYRERKRRIWIHDYQIALTARMVKEVEPDAPISFFLHIPFMNPSRFMQQTHAREIINGMLGADIIGFQTPRDIYNFAEAVRLAFGSDAIVSNVSPGREVHVVYKGRKSRLKVYPIGIDPERYSTNHLKMEAQKIRDKYNGRKIVLGVDRLDPTKRIPARLQAYYEFLENNPEWVGRVVMVQFAVPSREGVPAYIREKQLCESWVQRIREKFGDTAIEWHNRKMDVNSELLEWYRAATVMLVTPVLDGMNLVAKEFVAASHNGALILSRGAGAAWQLGGDGALTIDPNNITEIAVRLKLALEMSKRDRQERLRIQKKNVADETVFRWSEDILTDLFAVGK